MMASRLANVPLPTVVSTFTLGYIVRIIDAASDVLPLFNSFAGAGEGGPIPTYTDPDQIRAFLAKQGVR